MLLYSSSGGCLPKPMSPSVSVFVEYFAGIEFCLRLTRKSTITTITTPNNKSARRSPIIVPTMTPVLEPRDSLEFDVGMLPAPMPCTVIAITLGQEIDKIQYVVASDHPAELPILTLVIRSSHWCCSWWEFWRCNAYIKFVNILCKHDCMLPMLA